MLLSIALVTLVCTADEGVLSASSSEPARSGAHVTTKAHQAEAPGVINHQAANRALLVALDELSAEEKASTAQETTDRRNRIGVHRSLLSDFTGDLSPHLVWVRDSDSRHIAAVEIRSEGAVSVRIAVQAMLPADASVQIFDGYGEPRGPAYTRGDFDPREGNAVWLPSAEGDTLIVQITVPSEHARDAVSFTVTQIAHRYARLRSRMSRSRWRA